MKEYWNDNDFYRNKRCEKSKGRTRHRRTNRFLFLCCCIAVLVLTINLFKNHYFFTEDIHPCAPPSTTGINDTGISIGLNDGDDKTDDDSEDTWCLVLVNRWNELPTDYKVEPVELSNGQSIDKRIYLQLQKMFDAARADNIYPIVASGYRTTEKQQSLLDEKIADYEAEGYALKEATAKAEAWVAIPGKSEHQLGLGVDINADGVNSAGKEVYEWLDQNSYKFGFIHRYPADKTDITGVINEPWHYRYVGVKAATEIYNQGVCLEEYLNKVN